MVGVPFHAGPFESKAEAVELGGRPQPTTKGIDGRQNAPISRMLDLVELGDRPGLSQRPFSQATGGRIPDVLAEMIKVQQGRIQIFQVLENLLADPGSAIPARPR